MVVVFAGPKASLFRFISFASFYTNSYFSSLRRIRGGNCKRRITKLLIVLKTYFVNWLDWKLKHHLDEKGRPGFFFASLMFWDKTDINYTQKPC